MPCIIREGFARPAHEEYCAHASLGRMPCSDRTNAGRPSLAGWWPRTSASVTALAYNAQTKESTWTRPAFTPHAPVTPPITALRLALASAPSPLRYPDVHCAAATRSASRRPTASSAAIQHRPTGRRVPRSGCSRTGRFRPQVHQGRTGRPALLGVPIVARTLRRLKFPSSA